MGGDHDYVRPKTDGTFGLRTNWARLSSSAVPAQYPSHVELPKDIELITREQLETKTLRQWWYWQEWRRTHPLKQFSPSYLFRSYRAKYMSGKYGNGATFKHWMLGVATLGFVVTYSNNSNFHSYAKHH